MIAFARIFKEHSVSDVTRRFAGGGSGRHIYGLPHLTADLRFRFYLLLRLCFCSCAVVELGVCEFVGLQVGVCGFVCV